MDRHSYVMVCHIGLDAWETYYPHDRAVVGMLYRCVNFCRRGCLDMATNVVVRFAHSRTSPVCLSQADHDWDMRKRSSAAIVQHGTASSFTELGRSALAGSMLA